MPGQESALRDTEAAKEQLIFQLAEAEAKHALGESIQIKGLQEEVLPLLRTVMISLDLNRVVA